MFFPERIKNIKPSDRVLEIGPGSDPHPRSDILLEKQFVDPNENKEQRGNTPEIKTTKPIVFYEGDSFPFKDKEFDYVICSHVLEHVEDVCQFLTEVFRVSSKGYLEYPTIYYEYLYNFRVHKNLLKYDGVTLYYLKKKETLIDTFGSVQAIFLETLNKGYSSLVDDLKLVMFEGFEWNNFITIKKAPSLEYLCKKDYIVPLYDGGSSISFAKRVKNYLFKKARG